MKATFWTAAYARKLQGRSLPRSKLARIARAESKAAEKANLEARRVPLDPSRPIPERLMWFALSVKSRYEFQVARWLEERGWFTLVPIKTETKAINGKRGGKHRKQITRTMAELSGFVFAGMPTTPNWLSLEDCKAIYGPLATQGVPMPFPEAHVTLFQKTASETSKNALDRALAMDRLTKLRKQLERGGKAKIMDGPFQGFFVTVQSIRGNRVEGKVPMFGGETSVKFDINQLDAA